LYTSGGILSNELDIGCMAVAKLGHEGRSPR